jgi:hypothetical protein
MPWRGVAPVQLVIGFVGVVLLTSTVGIIVLALFNKDVPDELATVAIASMTGLAGLLTSPTGLLTTGRTARRAAAAGEAAATAIIASDGLAAAEADELADRHPPVGFGGPRHRA